MDVGHKVANYHTLQEKSDDLSESSDCKEERELENDVCVFLCVSARVHAFQYSCIPYMFTSWIKLPHV